jgi:hypothetical protein
MQLATSCCGAQHTTSDHMLVLSLHARDCCHCTKMPTVAYKAMPCSPPKPSRCSLMLLAAVRLPGPEALLLALPSLRPFILLLTAAFHCCTRCLYPLEPLPFTPFDPWLLSAATPSTPIWSRMPLPSPAASAAAGASTTAVVAALLDPLLLLIGPLGGSSCDSSRTCRGLGCTGTTASTAPV